VSLLRAPIVYVGPTLSADRVRSIVPDAIVRPPIQRGDLYRDRGLRGTFFVILDGVFQQALALSPREVAEVLEDGALVTGAASLGALRAAECWPLGMRGAGAIYRMFRRGWLGSDDEVAVSFDPDDPTRGASVALINVRYAARRLMLDGTLRRPEAERIVDAAARLFYAERSWRRILGEAHAPPALVSQLVLHDLKRRDAEHCLKLVARGIRADPTCFDRPRPRRAKLGASLERERSVNTLYRLTSPKLQKDFASWLLRSSGKRLREHSTPSTRGPSVDPPSLLYEALLLEAVRVGSSLAKGRQLRPDIEHRLEAEMWLAARHGVSDFSLLLASCPRGVRPRELLDTRDDLALALKARVFPPKGPVKRTRTE
jgi:hypothetical protein